jgi:hypothetical protein
MNYGFYGRPRIGFAGYGGPGMFGWFGEGKVPPCPPLKVVNDAGPDCRPQKDFCTIILRAIDLCRRAAARLEAKPQTPATQALFQQVFGQPTSAPWEIPGQPSRSMPAGDMVAQRFRVVANELQNRDTIYRCVPPNRCASIKSAGCYVDENPNRLRGLGQFHIVEREPQPELQPLPRVERPPCHPTDAIVVDKAAIALLCRNQVWLCPPFWMMTPVVQAGTLIHEMFHLCFGVTCAWFQHDARERRRNSAYCYEVFALGGPPFADPVSIAECSKVPV